jgi:hypothetical protein
MFLPFLRLNLYWCSGQTRFPRASKWPSANNAPACGHFCVQAKSWWLCLARQTVLPLMSISARPLALKLISFRWSAILCQIGVEAIDIFLIPFGNFLFATEALILRQAPYTEKYKSCFCASVPLWQIFLCRRQNYSLPAANF